MLKIESPQKVGLHPDRWKTCLKLLVDFCKSDQTPAAGLLVSREGKTTGTHLFGRQQLSGVNGSIQDDAIFLIASITKPLVAMAILQLVERGHFSLADRVTEFIPDFGKEGKHGITVRHLLTHTSGLPDMLPANRELRIDHAPLAEFVKQTAQIKPDFSAGRGVQYQSMGFAILGEIIQQVSGKTCAEYLQSEFFTPLGMHDTTLGAPDDWFAGEEPTINRIAEIRTPEDMEGCDWNWNNRYWQQLGAPWGGLLTTPMDLARFGQMMLNKGEVDGTRFLSPATINAATRNQLSCMRDVPEADRRCRPWGFGWRLNWPAHSANFGDFLGPNTFGHWGATGTAFWMDPDTNTQAVIFTTQPQEPHGKLLAKIANAVSAAVV